MARPTKDSVLFSGSLERELSEQVTDYAKQLRMTKTAVIETALAEYFERHPIPKDCED